MMPSLRKRVSSYFRQLSFHNEPRDRKQNVNENSFVTKYLQGKICSRHISLKEGPQIIYGKNPTDLPNYELGNYETGQTSLIGCYSGPNGGLTTVKRTEKHLSVLDADIDFIDTQDEIVQPPQPKKSPQRISGQPIDNTTMVIKVAGHEYCVTNKPKKHSKSHSLGSISDFKIEIEKTKIDKDFYVNNNLTDFQCKNQTEAVKPCDKLDQISSVKDEKPPRTVRKDQGQSSRRTGNRAPVKNYSISKSKSEGNPFPKKGKIIKIAQRPNVRGEDTTDSNIPKIVINDSSLPKEWNLKSDLVYGLSDSLYDENQITKAKNGDPIADCFGIIARRDSAILAVADGVNWGEKASIAAKSAVHGCLHYLEKTIFNNTKPFDNLTIKSEDCASSEALKPNLLTNTREVFVCLLRAFNCAHDLILENNGMLTTLTVAVVLPLKQKTLKTMDGHNVKTAPQEKRYICCVCNVGDTLAYVYSQKNGIRELTKGSHDINCNRDMRDALGALGPVDGINPELSNLTLSITTLSKGDVVLVASDGLTDNFDPNVCRFSVNSTVPEPKPKRQVKVEQEKPEPVPKQAPVKPPRKSRPGGDSSSRSSSVKSNSLSDRIPPESDNPLVAHFLKENSIQDKVKKPLVIENRASSLRRESSSQRGKEFSNKATQCKSTTEYKFLRSKTSIDFKTGSIKQVLRNEDGIPYVTPLQRYELQLLLMEDVLKNGLTGREPACTTAKKLCESLLSFTISITAAKRRTLEDVDLYYDNVNGVLVELSQQEKKTRRKRILEKLQGLPGKLDHVTVVAYNVGAFAY